MNNTQLTIAGLIRSLARFDPATPCVGHIWVADDFEDINPDLTPDEVIATIALADRTLDAESSLSWSFLCDCAETILAQRETDA
ncbi:hypothetical protein PMPD1_4445 (plasmid) [Paramixta manurensis]|uniref:DUF1380 domain-containing protein n=1 Tax=Paramixta manurensis TaxID=2740817 RepID=A0A6M8UWC9_9GAMM|nr:hypothetical protein PMPD1_4445 [Erwiniaceae bacterium PD-1]